MAAPTSEFWPLLHKMVRALAIEGKGIEEQTAALVEQMNAMPRGVINSHVANLELLTAAMTKLLNRAKTE
jgi:hypothetical protein